MSISVEVVTSFLSVLSLMAAAGSVTIIIAKAVPAVARAIDFMQPYAVHLAALIALVATFGSLYLSEVAGFIPCLLCWVQRGFMYPLAVLLPWAAARRSTNWKLVAGWVTAGALVSTFHYIWEWNPSLLGQEFCAASAPCTAIWFRHFGFVTIPFMAGIAFLTIATLTWLSAPGRNEA
jgi:disulfide bond formation protein DsbB